jgi:hypothetical protein
MIDEYKKGLLERNLGDVPMFRGEQGSGMALLITIIILLTLFLIGWCVL